MKLGFYFSVYKDELWAVRLVYQIKKFYPKADIICIFDGQGVNSNIDYIAKLGAKVRVGERLKGPGNGMVFSHRNLSVALEYSDAELFIKIDPDSYIWRRFNSFPESDFFGQNHKKSIGQAFTERVHYCHGACWGIRRPLVQKLVDSKIFYDELYKHPHNLYNRYQDGGKFRKVGDRAQASDLIMHEDFIFGDAVTKMGGSITRWKEVRLAQSQEIMQDPKELTWAVTHPTRSIW